MVNCWCALNTTGRRGHSVTLAVPLPNHCCGPVSLQHSFIRMGLMRKWGHPSGSNASRREQTADPGIQIVYLLRAWRVQAVDSQPSWKCSWLNKSWELHSEGLVCMKLSWGEPDPWLEVFTNFLVIRIICSFLLKVVQLFKVNRNIKCSKMALITVISR